MRSNSIKGLALALAVVVLGGCATSKEELLTHSDRTMMDVWQQETGGGGSGTGQVARRQLLDARQSLRRPLTDANVQAAPAEQMRYTRTAQSEEEPPRWQEMMRRSARPRSSPARCVT